LRKRLILLVPLLALFAFVAMTEERAEAADTTPPETTITSGPGDTSDGTAEFAFTSTESATTFKCKLVDQDSTRTDCISPKTYTNLTAGTEYTFRVWAKDAAGNIDTTPATLTFTSNGSGGTDPGGDRDGDTIPDTEDNCPDVYNKGQIDDDNDGVGNKCDDGSTTLPDADRDGVPDSTDQCPNVPGPAPTGCPADPGGTPGGGTTTWPNCIGTHIRPGDNIASIINDKSGRFCVHRGTYTVSTQALLKTGDKLDAEPGTWTSEGPARVPDPVVTLEGRGTDNLLRADGNDISISWVDITGASGTGNGTGAIAAGSAGSDFLVEYSRIHGNDSLGISNMNGTVRYSEFFENSSASAALGFNASAVKGITEYEAFGVYVHDEQGNGLWCDVGCKNSARPTPGCQTGCFWVHNSVVVNSNRAGIRYENSDSEALFENNVIRGNGISEHRGGIDIRDSQDAQVLNNKLSANNGIGVRATDSGRSDRVNLERILVQGNDLGGDRIVTCGGPVVCSGNTNVGSR
jgi:parallel beta-helix repeat protein